MDTSDPQSELEALRAEVRQLREENTRLQGVMKASLRRPTTARELAQPNFGRLLANIPDLAVQGYDANRTVIYWNEGSERLYGYAAEEALGRQLEDLIIPPPMREGVIAAVANWFEEGVPIPAEELDLRHKDGSTVPVLSNHLLVPGPEGPQFFCVDIELSGLRAAETRAAAATAAAEQANSAKTEFLAIVSHEMRSPLNPILALSSLLREELPEAVHREQMDIILSCGQELTEVIDRILLYTRLMSEPTAAENRPLDPASLVAEVVGRARDRMREAGTVLRSVPLGEGAMTPLVRTDLGKLRQILGDLVDNAVKFTREGEVVVRYGFEPDGERNGELVLEVEDTGIGIPAALRDQVLQPFAQADGTLQRAQGGLGLGLAISGKLIERMHGTLELDSEPGRGSRFTVRLPVAVIGDPAQEHERAAVVFPEARRVLVVEDDPGNAYALCRLLGHLERRVVHAPDTETARAALAAHEFDLILMDLSLPRESGLDFTHELLAPASPYRDIPVVAVTANAGVDHRKACLEAGMRHFLPKPVALRPLAALFGVEAPA